MSKRRFDFAEFYENYGVLFDADAYTEESAIDEYLKEFGDRVDCKREELTIEEDYIRWYPKMSKDDMWYLDIYDKEDNRGIYKCCSPDAPKAFKCWRIRTPKEVEINANR